MKRRWGIVVFSLCMLSVPARAADDPQIGIWKLDLAKSKYVTSTAPKSSTTTITPYGKDGISLVVDSVNANGEKVGAQYSAGYDGKPYPRTQTGAGPGYTVTLKHIDAQTYERTLYLGGKPVGTERSAISRDGKTRTLTQSGVDAQGKPINNVLVYEKQ